MPFDFVRLPIAAAIGFFLYYEKPDLWVWIGAVIIFGATYFNTWRETLKTEDDLGEKVDQ